MTERAEAVATIDIPTAYSIAAARNWFESHAAQFRFAQILVLQTGGDIDVIRARAESLSADDSDRRAYLKAIDALDKTRDLPKFTRLVPGTDMHRHQAKAAAITLLGRRAAAAIVQADRREQECLADDRHVY